MHPVNVQLGEKIGQRLRLGCGGWVFRQGAAQIAEPGYGNDVEAAAAQRLGEQLALIETAPRTMKHQNSRSAAPGSVFDRAVPGLHQLAYLFEGVPALASFAMGNEN